MVEQYNILTCRCNWYT